MLVIVIKPQILQLLTTSPNSSIVPKHIILHFKWGHWVNLDNQLVEKPFEGHKDLGTIVGQLDDSAFWNLNAHLKPSGKQAVKQNYMVRAIKTTITRFVTRFTGSFVWMEY